MTSHSNFLQKTPEITFSKSKTRRKPTFSILIPTWNNLNFLKLCIDSLKKNSRYKHQIILHINAGDDGTIEWAKKNGFDFSYSKENIGICFALNASSTLASSDYIVYFNDDMYACPDWDFWLLKEVKQQSSEYFFLSSTMIEPKDSNNTCVIAPFDFGDHPNKFKEKELLNSFKKFKKNDWTGATWPPNLVPKKLWNLVGGYSAEFSPGMYSDPDFSMKLWNVGVRNFKGVSKSRVYHFMSKSTKKINFKKFDGRRIFFRKWGISSNVFTTHYLRRGRNWSGPLGEPIINLRIRLKVFLTRIKLLFKHS